MRRSAGGGGGGKSGACTPEARADRLMAEVATLLGALTLTCSDFAQAVRSKRLSSTRGVVQFAEQMRDDCEKAAASVAEVMATKAIHRWSSARATLIEEGGKGRRMVNAATSPPPPPPAQEGPKFVTRDMAIQTDAEIMSPGPSSSPPDHRRNERGEEG